MMIEKLMILIIQELGPVGLLIVGLYLTLGKHIQKICAHIETINAEIGTINETVKACTGQICDKIDGKN